MKRKVNLLLLVFFIGSTAKAQDYKFRYFFDENFSSVAEEKAVITGKGFPVNGLIRLDCYSRQTGKMEKPEPGRSGQ